MRRKGRTLAWITGAACLLAFLATGLVLRGRLLETWWLHELKVGDAAEQEAATHGLVSIQSAQAIPWIGDIFVKACEEPRERKKQLVWTFEALLALGGAKAVTGVVEGREAETRTQVVEAIREGPFEDSTVIPVFVQFADDASAQVRGAVEVALRRCSTRLSSLSEEVIFDCVAGFRKLLKDDDAAIRSDAADDLMDFGPRASPAVPELILELGDEGTTVEDRVSEALGQIGPAAVGPLVEALSDSRPFIRARAAASLEKLGPVAAVVVPHLVELLSDTDADVRSMAVAALGAIGPAAKPAVPAISQMVSQPQPQPCRYISIRFQAAEALWRIDREADRVLPVLVEFLRDEEWNCRLGSTMILGDMGPLALDAVPVLTEILNHEPADLSEDLRLYVADALWKINQPAELILPVLVKALGAQSLEDSGVAFDLLGQMGPLAKVSVPALRAAQSHKERWVRDAAAKALKSIEAVPAESQLEVQRASQP